METPFTFNYNEIVKSVLDGTTERLMFVTREKSIIDNRGEIDYAYETEIDVVFAGTTVDACRQTIDYLVSNCEVEYPEERFEFFANQCYVDASYLEDFDIECDDAEEAINNIINEAATGDCDNVGSDDWNHQSVAYEFENLCDSIVLYWRWHRHVGYARTPIRLEYCIDYNLTTQRCLPEDSTTDAQLTRIVTPEEIKDCSTASELQDLIQQRVDDMGMWQKEVDVESFLKDLYEDSVRFGSLYSLPKNDLLIED